MVISERLFNRLVLSAVGLGFACLAIVGLAAAVVVNRNQDFTDWVNHTYEVKTDIGQMRSLVDRAESARRGYLLSRDPNMRKLFDDTIAQLPIELDAIRRMTPDNPQQQTNVAHMLPMVTREQAVLRKSVDQAQQGDAAGAIASFNTDGSVLLVAQIRNLADTMTRQEDRLLDERNQQQRETVEALYVILVVAGFLMAAVGAGSIWVIWQYTRDLTQARDAERKLNENLEQAVDERTAELKRANEEIQRFAYIVSHDLRSPLVNVMGFTSELEAATKPLSALIDRAEAEAPQLMTPEARDAVRTDLPESVRFIRSSTKKMDDLINAILKLSREGRRVLAPEPLPMAQVLQGVANNVRHRADEKGAKVEIAGDIPDIVSDRFAVEQIFGNLVDNAIKYLSPKRPGVIRISGHREAGGRVVYEVADNGRGIDPRDHDRVFDLFRRSGAQDQPGEGIGLAHVRALAYRLGGLISCESALDQGATFRLSVPPKLATSQGAES